MRVRDLAEPYPVVSADDDAMAAARLFVERRLPALLVLDADQRPYPVVPGSQLLKVMVPDFVLEDPALAGGPRGADIEPLAEHLHGCTVAQWLPRHGTMPAVSGPDGDAAQIAALMTRTHTPLVTVVQDDSGRTWAVGAITAARLMEYFLTRA